MTNNRIFLVGPMGAGKTTIGRQLATALEKEFIDCDQEIVRRTGVSIPVIFDVEGESGFRRRETDALQDLTARPGVVLATGGGAILSEVNRRYLKERGRVIYLQASVDQILRRTVRDRNRPLLQSADPRATLVDLMTVRGALYEEVADMTIDTDDRSVRAVVKEILDKLES